MNASMKMVDAVTSVYQRTAQLCALVHPATFWIWTWRLVVRSRNVRYSLILINHCSIIADTNTSTDSNREFQVLPSHFCFQLFSHKTRLSAVPFSMYGNPISLHGRLNMCLNGWRNWTNTNLLLKEETFHHVVVSEDICMNFCDSF